MDVVYAASWISAELLLHKCYIDLFDSLSCQLVRHCNEMKPLQSLLFNMAVADYRSHHDSPDIYSSVHVYKVMKNVTDGVFS